MAADEKRDAGRGNKDDSVKKQEDHEEQTTHRHHRTQILINDNIRIQGVTRRCRLY